MNHVPGLLIVEGNADRLAREGQTKHVDRLERHLQGLVDNGTLRLNRLKIRNELDLDFARTFASCARYDGVLLVAHGNTEGAEATAERSLPWSDIASMLASVEPRALLAMSCMAAATDPARALFDAIPTLVAIGGSPATLTIAQAELAFVELMFATYGSVIPSELSMLISLYNAGETGGAVGWRHRRSFNAGSEQDRLIVDVFANVAKVIMDRDRPRRPIRRRTIRPLGSRPRAYARI